MVFWIGVFLRYRFFNILVTATVSCTFSLTWQASHSGLRSRSRTCPNRRRDPGTGA
jgi:hypothetical protein